LVTIENGSTPTSIAANSQYVFWTTIANVNNDPIVLKMPLGGGAPSVVASGGLFDGADSLVLDNSNVYWVLDKSMGGSQRWVYSAPLAGGAPFIVFKNTQQGAKQGASLAVPFTGQRVVQTSDLYFAAPGNEAIYDLHLSSGLFSHWTAVQLPQLHPPNSNLLFNYYATSIVASNGTIYFVDDQKGVYEMPVSGGTTTPLPTPPPTQIPSGVSITAAVGSPIDTDGVNLYYTSASGTSILQSSVSGTAAVVFANEPASSLLLSAGYLYWTNSVAGTVKKRALNGSPAITIASGQNSPMHIAVNADQVFWGVKSGLLSAPR